MTAEFGSYKKDDRRIVIKKGESEMFHPADFVVLMTKTDVVMAFVDFSGGRFNGKKNEYETAYFDAIAKSIRKFGNYKQAFTNYIFSAFNPFISAEYGGLGLDPEKPIKMSIEEFKDTHGGQAPLEFIEGICCKR
jgi:hypothetical protein